MDKKYRINYKNNIPILFIHGLGANEKQYQPIIKYLKKRGLGRFYQFKYENNSGRSPLKNIAKGLAEYIKENIKENNINIIAFSQGGIIALAYLKYYKNKNVVKLFTLCSPHKGSLLAKIANLPGLIDLRPKSVLLNELDDFAKKSNIDIYSVFTPLDLMVFPGWNAMPDYGLKKMIFAPAHPLAFMWPSTKKFIFKNLL